MVKILHMISSFFLLNVAMSRKMGVKYVQKYQKNSFCDMRREGNSELKSLYHFYKPKSVNQEYYMKGLQDSYTKILFVVGPAGTGKTALACNQAIKELKSGSVNKIVITRPIVPVEDEELGFLPGTIQKKMDPWTRPIFDIFNEFYSKKDIDTMVYNNVIEISPLAFMRGRTFKNAFIIADEMQNSSPGQMLMLTTRIGQDSKMVITGDLKQSDRGIESGLSDFIDRFKKYTSFLSENNMDSNVGIKIVELGVDDIERSKVIKKLLEIYDFKSHIIHKPARSSEVSTKKIQPSEIVSLQNDAALMPETDFLRSIREQ